MLLFARLHQKSGYCPCRAAAVSLPALSTIHFELAALSDNATETPDSAYLTRNLTARVAAYLAQLQRELDLGILCYPKIQANPG